MKIDEEMYLYILSKLKMFMTPDDATDVLSSVILSLKGRELKHINNPVGYIINACKIACWCKSSPYQVEKRGKIRTDSNNISDYFEIADTSSEETSEFDSIDIWTELNNCTCSWWEKELFKRRVLENKTLKELAKETKLSITQVYYSINKVRGKLKKQIENSYKNKAK